MSAIFHISYSVNSVMAVVHIYQIKSVLSAKDRRGCAKTTSFQKIVLFEIMCLCYFVGSERGDQESEGHASGGEGDQEGSEVDGEGVEQEEEERQSEGGEIKLGCFCQELYFISVLNLGFFYSLYNFKLAVTSMGSCSGACVLVHHFGMCIILKKVNCMSQSCHAHLFFSAHLIQHNSSFHFFYLLFFFPVFY